VSPAVEAAVLAAARARLAERPPRPRRRLPWLAPLVAAAAVVLWLLRAPASGRADLDGNGRVDVLDAFRLARELGSAEADPRADFDGDGGVDERDVEHVLALAVRLDA
jgi:hypothetical protein